jgi:hypothetical protein
VTKVIREEIKKFLEYNENTTYLNLWNTAKAMLRGKFIAINAYIKKTETSKINNLVMHIKLLAKQKQTKPKTSRWREIIKMAKINEIKTKQTIQRNNKTKSWFFKKINKLDKPLALQNRGGRRPKLIKSEMKKGT